MQTSQTSQIEVTVHKSLKKPDLWVFPETNNKEKLEWAQSLIEVKNTMNQKSFDRLIRENLHVSLNTAYLWIGRCQTLAGTVPNALARKALLEVTNGKDLFSGSQISDRLVAGLRKFPVPPEGTSYEDCRDWALEVEVVASHHAGVKNAPESWQIQTAKARFSEVFRRARAEGPQRITRQGKDGVVMVAEEQYEQLVGKSHQPKSLVQFFRSSPLVGVELDLERDRDAGRDIEL